MANENLKKPGNDSKVPDTLEDQEKKKKIIILVGLIIVVLAILIGTAYYFSNSGNDDDSDNDGKNPGNIVKPSVDEDDDKNPEPVDNDTTNNVIVYRPAEKPEPIIPPVPETPTTITGSEEDSLISVDFDEETRTINLSGTSKYVAKVNDNFGSGFNNIVQVKISLNTKYKYDDLENMDFTVTTDVNNGKKNYFLDTVQEDENGNLYFFWLQAVGKGLDLNPKLTINYGDGNIEEYTMDLSSINIQTPLEKGEDLAQSLVSTQGNQIVVGGVELNLDYELTILEEVPVKDEENSNDGTTVIAADDQTTTNPDSTVDSSNPSEPVVPEDKNYILKVTGMDEKNVYTPESAIKLGFEGYKYVIALKFYAPEDFTNTPDEIAKIKFEKSYVSGEGKVEDVTQSNSTLKIHSELDSKGTTRYYIIVLMAVDGVYPGNNPYVSIDWDGDGNEHGTSRYIFDFSEFNYVDPEVSETPKDPVVPPVDTNTDENKDNQNTLDSSNQNDSVVSDGDVADATLDDEEETVSDDENNLDEQENTDDDTSIEDTTPSGEEISPDTTVPSVGDTGDVVLEVNDVVNN